MSEYSSNKKGGRASAIIWIIAIIAIILLVIGVCFPAFASALGNDVSNFVGHHKNTSSSSSTSTSSSSSATPMTPFTLATQEKKDKSAAEKKNSERKLSAADRTALIKKLSITTIDPEFASSGKVIKLSIGSKAELASFKWSDSLTIPSTSSDPATILKQLQDQIKVNPVVGITWCNYFAHVTVAGTKLASINKFLQQCDVDANQIKPQVGNFLPLRDVTDPTTVSDTALQNAKSENLAYQKISGQVNTLLEKFKLGDIESPTSTLNYHRVAGGATIDIPAIEVNPKQESEKALIIYLDAKSQCELLYKGGINTGDMRPETFAIPSCETQATTTPSSPATPSHSTPSTPTHSTPSTPGTPTHTTVVPPTTCKSGYYYDTKYAQCFLQKSQSSSGYTYPSGKPTVKETEPASAPKPVTTTKAAAPSPSASATPAPSTTAVPVAPVTDPTQTACVPSPIKSCP